MNFVLRMVCCGATGLAVGQLGGYAFSPWTWVIMFSMVGYGALCFYWGKESK